MPQETFGASKTTLDALVMKENLSRLDLIKIDVDGAEDDVIAGAEATIAKYRPDIIIEVAPYTLLERGLLPDAPLKKLKALDYYFEDLDGNSLGEHDYNKLLSQPKGYGQDIVARHRSKAMLKY